MACEKDIWSIVKVKTQKIVWKTNWTSEFFLEPKSAKLQVKTVYKLLQTMLYLKKNNKNNPHPKKRGKIDHF